MSLTRQRRFYDGKQKMPSLKELRIISSSFLFTASHLQYESRVQRCGEIVNQIHGPVDQCMFIFFSLKYCIGWVSSGFNNNRFPLGIDIFSISSFKFWWYEQKDGSAYRVTIIDWHRCIHFRAPIHLSKHINPFLLPSSMG